mgnify:CR=1 FL=1
MRMLLRDLSPGTAYSLQIRTTSDAASSEWSRKFEISTDVDNIAPSPPFYLHRVYWLKDKERKSL